MRHAILQANCIRLQARRAHGMVNPFLLFSVAGDWLSTALYKGANKVSVFLTWRRKYSRLPKCRTTSKIGRWTKSKKKEQVSESHATVTCHSHIPNSHTTVTCHGYIPVTYQSHTTVTCHSHISVTCHSHISVTCHSHMPQSQPYAVKLYSWTFIVCLCFLFLIISK
jgi:hypothetical protein